MSDKDNKNEFVFEDENENHTQEYTESSYAGSTENLKTIFKNKRIVTLAGGVVAVWLLSFILENVFGSDEKIVEKVASNEDVQQATNELTGVDETVDSNTSDVKELDDNRLNIVEPKVEPVTNINKDVQNNVANNTATIKSMQDSSEVTKIQLNQMSNQVAEIAQQVTRVAASSDNVAEKMAVIEAKAKAKAEAAKVVIQHKLEHYHIKALIDGRAWLVGPDKEYVTVVVGDKLKDYGSIVEIYSEKGIISTSSGRIIYFASS
tara:strand:+ start:1048 stop:1836 length:789 start_codon:yes stop_codon:yes gene_type:complete